MRPRLLCVGAVIALGVARAASGQVDPSGAWRTWTSEHFRIHARSELSSAAERLTREAERAYALLADELTPPRGRIDVALLDNVDFSNGFASVFPTNRITLYLPPPGDNLSLGRYDDWLRLVTTHELVHVFHLDRADGIWAVLRAVFGRNPGLFPNGYQPSWVTEGLATYYESRFTTAGRVRGGFHSQLLSAAASSQRWPRPQDLTFGSPIWPAGFGPYAWGTQFFADQAALFGDSVLPRFVERTSRQAWPLAVSGPMRSAGGDGAEESWTRLRARWSAAESHLPARPLARGLRLQPHPELAPDGRTLAYVHDDGRQLRHVALMSLNDEQVIARHRLNGSPDLAWSGSSILISQLDFVSPVEIGSDLYRWTPGQRWQRLTRGARAGAPFALGGGRVGFLGIQPGQRGVYQLDPDAESVRPVPVPTADDWGHLAVSPDGEWVAGARHVDGRWDIVLWPVGDPTAVTRVTNDATFDADPHWAPDGGLLLFSSERAGLPQIYGYRPGSGEIVQLSFEPTGAREPSMTPDGRLIYASVMDDGHAVMELDALVPEPWDSVEVALPPLESAPDVEMSAGAYNPWPAIVPRYWIPVFRDEGTAGSFFGAATSGSDLIGRVAYGAAVTYAPTARRWEGAFSARYSRWRSVSLDLGAEQTWDFAGLLDLEPDQQVPIGVRERSAASGITWRWRRWRRSVSIRLGGEVEQDAFFNDGSVPLGFTLANRTFANAVGSFSAGYTQRPILAISTENGVVVSSVFRRRWEVQGAGWSYESRIALSGYLALPLPGFAHWVLAAQVRAGLTGGPTPATYRIGGESSGRFELAPGVSLGGSRRTFPMRGYPEGVMRFTRAVVSVLELRIPLAAVGRAIWKLPLGIDRISLTPFAEMGGGWQEGESISPAKFADAGAELVLDLFIGFDFPLRVRAGGAFALADGLGVSGGDLRAYLAVGPSF